MKSAQILSPDSLRHHLHPADKRECISDSGALCNSSPSIDWLRNRIAKRPTLFTKSTRDLRVNRVGKVT